MCRYKSQNAVQVSWRWVVGGKERWLRRARAWWKGETRARVCKEGKGYRLGVGLSVLRELDGGEEDGEGATVLAADLGDGKCVVVVVVVVGGQMVICSNSRNCK